MKRPYGVPGLVRLHLAYSGGLLVLVVLVVSDGFGSGVLARLGLLAFVTVLFVSRWNHLTIDRRLSPYAAFGSGVWVGLAAGFALLIMVAGGFSSSATAVPAGSILFAATLGILGVWFLTRKSHGSGSFLTRKRDVGPWLAFGSGMWFGALIGIGVSILVFISIGINWSSYQF